MILKFFLHVSRDEQKKRFMERLDTPEKSWKFSLADIQERDYWDDYMHAFEEAIQATAGELAPWYVVPADHKWFTRTHRRWRYWRSAGQPRTELPADRRYEEKGTGYGA